MKKPILIIVIFIIALVGVLLIKKSAMPDRPKVAASSPEGNSSPASIPHATPETGAVADSPRKRIPLPNPVVPHLSRSEVPLGLHPLFGWKDSGGYVPRRRLVEAIDHELSKAKVRAMLAFVRSMPEAVGLDKVKTFTMYALFK